MNLPVLPFISFLTDRQRNFFYFVAGQHGDQKRKYTNDPYTNHLVDVAKLVFDHYNEPMAVEIALGHDVFEDPWVDMHPIEQAWRMFDALRECGYDKWKAKIAVDGIFDLTDRYTSAEYPTWNREKRKSAEADRLSTIPVRSYMVKCADMIHNTESIVEHDENFAKVYLAEKQRILDARDMKGYTLYDMAVSTLNESLVKIYVGE